MTPFVPLLHSHSPWRVLAAAAVAAAMVLGCGGGVDSGGTGAPAQSFASGPISGFGSVIVNGVHFDDASATVLDDDGDVQPRGALKLGMTVEVNGGAVTRDPVTRDAKAVASSIRFGSAIRGPVQAVDAAASAMTVLGQRVTVDADTVFNGVAGLAALRTGMLLDVHALLDTASGTYTATRIAHQSSLATFRLRGIVSGHDPVAKVFSIGGARIGYAGVLPQDLPQLADGAVARVALQTAQQGGLWVLAKAAIGRPQLPGGVDAEVEGFVTNFAGLASFEVDGVPVDASGARVVFKHGTSEQLVNGVRVEVEGIVRDGVIVARKVSLRKTGASEDEGDDDDDGSADDEDDDDAKRFTLQGAVDSVNVSQRSFMLRGVTVLHDNRTRFIRGGIDDLAAGAQVEVKGVLAAGGMQLQATRIRFGT